MLLLLLAAVWLFYNSSANRHFHVMSNGYVITHSHPIQHPQSDQGTSQTHQHTEKEFKLLGLFNALFFSVISLFVIRPCLRTCPPAIRIRLIQLVPVRECYQVFHYHAPPVPC